MLPFKKIICPTDFSEPSFTALKEAGEVALHFAAELWLIHVVPPVPVSYPYPYSPVSPGFDVARYQQELAQSSEHALQEVAAQKVSTQVRTRATVVIGDPAREIVRLAREGEADLIVIATHGQTGWRHVIFGSVAEKVVRLSSCPVLTIRAPREDSG